VTQQLIITTPANTGTGDSPKSAFDKINANFTDLYGKVGAVVNVSAFAPAANGTTDDTAAFTSAFASLGVLGGTVVYTGRYYIAGPLVIPPNVTLKGPMSLVGGSNSELPTPYNSLSALILNTANPIYVSTGAGIDGALIIPQGMTFPQSVATAWVGTGVQLQGDNAFCINSMILGFNQGVIDGPTSSFTGAISNGSGGAGNILTVSALTGVVLPGMVLYSNSVQPSGGTVVLSQISGPTGGAGTYTVTGSQLITAEAMFGNIGQGPKCMNLKIDCVNGVLFNSPEDTGHCFNVECFPYATISNVSKPSNWADRLGTAFNVQNLYAGSGANCSFYDCFAYGYLNGYYLLATNDSILDGCWADGTNALANCVGFSIIGGFGGAENKLTSCVATGQQTGFFINNNIGTETMLVHATCSANEVSTVAGVNKSIMINSGDCYIIGATIRGSGSGGSGGYTSSAVYINTNTSRVIVDGLRSQGLNGTLQPIYNQGQTPYLFVGNCDFRDFNLGSIPIYQQLCQSVTSAGQITNLPLSGNNETYLLTGTTTCAGMSGGYPGRRIRLIIVSGLVINSGQAAPNGIVLLGGQNTTFPAGAVIELTYVAASGYSGQWFQTTPAPVNSTGWGTATGGSVQNNFAGGAATLATLGAAVAQIINAMTKAGVAIGV
jgi:hypothetical protein